MKIQFRKFLLTSMLAALICTIGTVRADDTDVYWNAKSVLPPGSEPVVMFSLDYRPNLGSAACQGGECAALIAEGYLSPTGPYTFFDVLRGALKKAFEPLEGIRVGLMLNHEHRNNCEGFGQVGCSNGGYIAMGASLFEAGDANGAKARFHSILDSIPTPSGSSSHSYQGKELFFEFFRYLTGQEVYNGHNGWTDYGTTSAQNLDIDNPGVSWDPWIEKPPASKPVYASPLELAGECTKIYTVNSMFFNTNQENDSDNAIEAPVSDGGFGSRQAQFADVIQYLNDADLGDGNYGTIPNIDGKQNVTSYFLVNDNFVNSSSVHYARAGGTGAPLSLSEDPDELVNTLNEIFRQILSTSTTFVAASVPVNVFNRAEVTDNVYIALFQVDQDKRPYWVGNVKKLKIADETSLTPGVLVDALDDPAVAADGRIRADALTYWTMPGYLPPPDPNENEVAGRDGRSVARGGAGQRIKGYVSGSPQPANGLGGRTIYYDRTSSSLADLDVSSLVASDLQSDFGAATAGEAEDLIAYARGLDIDDLDGDAETTEARPWIFGDPLHSRPLPLNYGAINGHGPGNPAIYVAVGSNDGMLRMIRNTSSGGSELGEEVWAFLPRNAMGAQSALRSNAAATPHPYTLDGAPVAYIQDVNQDGTIEPGDGDRVFLYVGMRRGGKAYYAFDITYPEAPQLMWTIEKGGDFAELGYTFSNPRVGLIKTATGPRAVVMFAGGYDMNKDLRGSVGTDDSEGNAIFVVDATTGDLIWKAIGGSGSGSSTVFEHPDLVDSIPSTLTVADTNGDAYTDRIVVGDTGGNVWRADLVGIDTSNWKLTLLASLGRHASGGIDSDRRFFHRPDLVPSKDSYGIFDGVLIGSGDRADPLDKGGTPENWFYLIKDRQTNVGSNLDTGLDHDDFGDVTSNCLMSGTCSIDLTDGWRLQLQEVGEKVLATALTVVGKVFFTTYIPPGTGALTSCAPSEGSGRLYAVSLQDATPVINYDTSDDGSGDTEEPNSTNDRFTDLNSAGIPAEVVSVPPDKILRPDLSIDDINVKTRWRTFWYADEESDL